MLHLEVSKWLRPNIAARCAREVISLPNLASEGFSNGCSQRSLRGYFMMQRFYDVRYLFVVVFLILAAAVTPAQVSTGNILGTVTDPAGALVNSAKVKVTNVRTNEVRIAQSNSSAGLFDVPNLIAGHYDVAVNAPGFSAETITDVTLDVGSERERSNPP